MIGMVIWERVKGWNCPLGIILHVSKMPSLRKTSIGCLGLNTGVSLALKLIITYMVRRLAGYIWAVCFEDLLCFVF